MRNAAIVSAIALAIAIGAGPTLPAGLSVSVGPAEVSVGDDGANANASAGDTSSSVGAGDDGVSASIGSTAPGGPDASGTAEVPPVGTGPLPVEAPDNIVPDAQVLPAQETAVLTEEPETERSQSSFDSALTHGGETRVLAFERQEDRLAALLALVSDCSRYGGLDEMIDDRRITIIRLSDVLEPSFAARLAVALIFDSGGRNEALSTARRNAGLQAVLDRESIEVDQVLALEVGANGLTEVFVFDDAETGALIPTLASWLRVLLPVRDCPVEDPIITASIGPKEIIEPLAVESQPMPPPLASKADDALAAPPAEVEPADPLAGIEADTLAAAELGQLLDRIAVVDAQLLSLDANARLGVVFEVASVPAPATWGAGIVSSTHALTEAIARSEGVSPTLSDDGEDIITSSIAPDMRTEAIEEQANDQRLLEACADFIGSLAEDLDSLMAGLAASGDMYLVPIEGCRPQSNQGAVSAMRALLAANSRVQSELAASGYEPSDLVGASIDEAGRLAIFVVN